MSVKIKEYHRTFLHYPSRNGPSLGEKLHNLGRGGAPTVRETPKPRENIRDRYVGVSTVANTTKYHNALEIVGSHLREITIQEKGDQQFDQWVTPWERIWSPLSRNARKGFLPVVDGNAMVVGYSGPVLSMEMLIGRATGLALIYTAEETLKYHRMFVGATSLHSVPDLSVYGDGLNYFAVMTDTEGEVTSFQFAYPSINGSAESTGFPILGWLKILQGGLKIFMSVRNGSRTIGRQPPSPPPAPQRALPPGRTGPPSRPPTDPGRTAPPNPTNARPGDQTYSGPTSSPPVVRDPRSRSQLEHEIELARKRLVDAAPKQTPLRVAVNRVRKEAGLPPVPNTTVIDAPGAIANEALVQRLHDEFVAWLKANPNAPLSFKLERLTRVNRAMWRDPFPTK